MTIYTILLGGFVAVTLLDSLGAIASRRFDFNYALLSPLSILIFGMVAAWAAPLSNFYTAVSIAGLVGLYDGTIGWKISKALDANMGVLASEDSEQLEWRTIVLTISFAMICGMVGAYFGG